MNAGAKTSDLAAVIVTWNNQDLIAAALSSLLDDLSGSGLRHEVWLVDSASSDGSVDLVQERFPQVRLIASDKNIGFGACNNLALRSMGFVEGAPAEQLPRAVFLLNPDTVTQPGACRRLYEGLMASDDVGMVGARLSYGDGSFQHSAFRFPDLRQIWSEFFPRRAACWRGASTAVIPAPGTPAAKPSRWTLRWARPCCCGERRSCKAAASTKTSSSTAKRWIGPGGSGGMVGASCVCPRPM